MPKKFIFLQRVDSTNNYAMAMVQQGAANSGDAVFAMEQTAGKGRRGKVWKSTTGQNILLSIVAQMQWLPAQQQFKLSMAVALGCRDFFLTYITENIKIKWPNDIFINDSKAGGILIENIIKGNLWQWSVVGIGLNINQEDFETKEFTATSLKKLTGKDYDVIELAQSLHKFILERLNALKSISVIEILKEYNEHLFNKGKIVKLKKGNIVFETKIEKVTQTGELITKDTMERSFGFDEIQWINLPLS